MTDAPDTPATPSPAGSAPPPPRNSPLGAPAPRRVDPSAIMIGIGGAVLVLALWWLLTTPRNIGDGGSDSARLGQVEQRLAALDAQREQTAALGPRLDAVRDQTTALGARLQELGPLDGRIRALEGRPAPDLRPLEAQAQTLTERTATAERAAAQAMDRVAANERRLQQIESRPAFDPAAVAPRQALDTLTGRLDQLAQRIEAQGTRLQQVDGETTRRLQEAAQQDQQREAAARAADERQEAAARQADEQRDAATRQALEQRVGALDASVGQKLTAMEQALGQRVAALEQAQQRVAAIEGRTARLAAVDGVRASLLAGQPLGEALGKLQGAPPALTRFAQSAPPTEASLRLSFEDAAKAGRAASDAAMQPDGSRQGVVDSALARLGGLVTVRRGEQVVWGDAAEAEIERARRALEAGDVEMSLTFLEKLPPPARAAMQPWADQARALLAARAALRQMAAG